MIESQGRSNVATELMIYHMNVCIHCIPLSLSLSLSLSLTHSTYLFAPSTPSFPVLFFYSFSFVHQRISLFYSIYALPLFWVSIQPLIPPLLLFTIFSSPPFSSPSSLHYTSSSVSSTPLFISLCHPPLHPTLSLTHTHTHTHTLPSSHRCHKKRLTEWPLLSSHLAPLTARTLPSSPTTPLYLQKPKVSW